MTDTMTTPTTDELCPETQEPEEYPDWNKRTYSYPDMTWFPGLEEVSGISDDAAAGPIGKLMCASLTGSLRQIQPRHAMLLPLMTDLPDNARIYRERNGVGKEFYRLKFRIPGEGRGGSRLVSQYLGNPPPDLLKWMEGILDESKIFRDARMRRRQQFDTERIGLLKALFKWVHWIAKDIARDADFRFKGYRLMEVRA